MKIIFLSCCKVDMFVKRERKKKKKLKKKLWVACETVRFTLRPVSFDAFVGDLAGTRDNLFDTDISPGFCESARLVGQN